MTSRMKLVAVNSVLGMGLALFSGVQAEARQNIQPAVQGGQTSGQLEAYGGAVILVEHNSVSLSWQPANDPRVTGYEVMYGTTPDFGKKKQVDVGVTSIVIEGLQQGNTWYFAVRSMGKIGKEKSYSTPTNLVTKVIPKIKGDH